jgi:hypothetical protein
MPTLPAGLQLRGSPSSPSRRMEIQCDCPRKGGSRAHCHGAPPSFSFLYYPLTTNENSTSPSHHCQRHAHFLTTAFPDVINQLVIQAKRGVSLTAYDILVFENMLLAHLLASCMFGACPNHLGA